MAFCDFRIKFDPEKDTYEDITKRILYSIIIKPLKAKKPRVIFIAGDSGEGKSYTSLRLQELLCEIQGLELKPIMEHINVFLPIEYPQKLDNLLHNKELKKVNILCMHEAREVVKAKLWHSFLNQTIADVNAMSRAVKRLCFIVISQFIRDITTDIRYTLHYYCKVSRAVKGRARLYFYVLWKDDSDLEKPKLRKRKLSGYLVSPTGVHRRFVPQYFEMKLPDKEIRQRFNQLDYDSKVNIIKQKTEKLIQELKKDMDTGSKKVERMLNWYIEHTENISYIAKRTKKGWRLLSSFQDMHELTKVEAQKFQHMLNKKLKEKGMIENE